MSRQQYDAMFDYALRLKDAGLVAATAAAQVGGSDKILDLGAARVDARAIIDVSACEKDTGDEQYIVCIQGSTSATFASGVFTLAAALFGDSSKTFETVDTAVPRRQEIAFTNEVNGTVYRYVRAYTFVAGTIATGINYTANVVQEA